MELNFRELYGKLTLREKSLYPGNGIWKLINENKGN